MTPRTAVALCFALASGAALAQAPASFRDCPDCPELIAIPAGSYQMGTVAGEEEREGLSIQFRRRSEPRHKVEAKRFAAGKYEVTRGEYRQFAEATKRVHEGCFIRAGAEMDFVLVAARNWTSPGYAQDDRHPVTCVSWHDATAYAEWLAKRTGKR